MPLWACATKACRGSRLPRAVTAAFPDSRIVWIALLYSFGAHGIMTLNDFKSVEGDTVMGVRSLPVQLGVGPAARLACLVMGAAQAGVIALLVMWDAPVHALVIALSSPCRSP